MTLISAVILNIIFIPYNRFILCTFHQILCIRQSNKKDEMSEICVTHKRDIKYTKNFWRKT